MVLMTYHQLCDKKQETLIYYPAAGKKIINIPNTVKEINEYAFT